VSGSTFVRLTEERRPDADGVEAIRTAEWLVVVDAPASIPADESPPGGIARRGSIGKKVVKSKAAFVREHPDNVSADDSCFVMMPFAEPLGKHYELIFRPAIENAKLKLASLLIPRGPRLPTRSSRVHRGRGPCPRRRCARRSDGEDTKRGEEPLQCSEVSDITRVNDSGTLGGESRHDRVDSRRRAYLAERHARKLHDRV